MAEELVGIRLRTDGVVEATNGVALSGKAVEDLGKKAAAAAPQLAKVGVSAGQTSQAMRQLPAQITDVATSLASGMPAWLVFVQQGGQIKDSFGGAMPALRAITGLMTPLALGLGGAAAASGLLTAAWFNGRQEAQEYARSIILTGNAAGVTASQLDTMAAAQARQAGTQGASAAALAQLVSTGRVARENLAQLTDVAVRMERTVGQSVETTVKMFADLGRDPVSAAAKLNESVNFLTADLYKQIVALSQQGREADAAALAQQALADATLPRLEELDRQLGYIDRGWRDITEWAPRAWDAMKGVGRADTIDQQIVEVQAKVLRLRQAARGDAVARPGEFWAHFFGDEPVEQQIVNAEKVLAKLRESKALSEQQAQSQAASARQTRKEVEGLRDAAGRKGGADKGLRAFMGPLTFDETWPAANVSETLKGRDSLRQARVDELDSYEDTDRELVRQRIETEAKLRAEAKKTADYLQTLEEQRQAALRPQWQQMVADWNDVQLEMVRSADDTMFATLRAGEDAWVRWMTTGKLSIRDVFATFAAEQARAGFRQLAGAGLRLLLGGSGGSAAGGNSGQTIDFGDGSSFPGRAGGGDVQAGRAYVAGEKVPELLFMGRQSGTVVANDKLGGGGGRTVVFAPVFNVDARTDKAEILQILHRGMQAAQADLLEKMDRGEI